MTHLEITNITLTAENIPEIMERTGISESALKDMLKRDQARNMIRMLTIQTITDPITMMTWHDATMWKSD